MEISCYETLLFDKNSLVFRNTELCGHMSHFTSSGECILRAVTSLVDYCWVEQFCLLGSSAVLSGKNNVRFRRNILLPPSCSKSKPGRKAAPASSAGYLLVLIYASEAIFSFEMSVGIYWTTDRTLHDHCCENLGSNMLVDFKRSEKFRNNFKYYYNKIHIIRTGHAVA
jgi:hypothetical protein